MDTITLDELAGVMTMQQIIDLTDDDETGAVNQVVLDEVYASAVRDLDFYAIDHYTLPLPAVPSVKELHRQLTKCHLYFRRGAYPEEVMTLYEALQEKMEALTPTSLGISA